LARFLGSLNVYKIWLRPTGLVWFGWLASFRLRDKCIAALLLLYQVCLPVVQVLFPSFHMKKNSWSLEVLCGGLSKKICHSFSFRFCCSFRVFIKKTLCRPGSGFSKEPVTVSIAGFIESGFSKLLLSTVPFEH
jgi:hypothetical protein